MKLMLYKKQSNLMEICLTTSKTIHRDKQTEIKICNKTKQRSIYKFCRLQKKIQLKNYNYPSFVMAIFEEENLCNESNLSNVF